MNWDRSINNIIRPKPMRRHIDAGFGDWSCHRTFRQYVTFFFEEMGDISNYDYMNGRCGILEDLKPAETN